MTSRHIEDQTTGSPVRALLRAALVATSTLALSMTLLVGPGVMPAVADPPLTVEEAKIQVAQLETEAAALDEQALDVKVKLTAGTKKLATKQEEVRQQTAKVARIRKQVGQVALAQFQNRNLDTTAQLFFNEDTDGFLNKMATVEKVSENQNTVLQDFQGQQARLADLERSARVDVAALQTQDQELARLRVASKAKITESKAVLAKLTKEERERIAAEEAAAQAAAQKAAEEAAAAERSANSSNNSSDSDDSDATTPSTGDRTSSSGKGAVALAYAIKQIGKPYSFGADGPNAFDCSGLTSAAWRTAGVSIPRTSRTQSTGAGRSVARSDLKPGDLVFFYSPVSHVAIYAGNGMVVHAPHAGSSVKYIKMKYMPYAGARRPA